ncbi:SH3 domain-containing protein [Haliea sp. E17]|uniref:SH3 domain-containing protein n=1 Tax=Haliea sp. E17 TaxID=3401576 RepID=UPI003AAEE987
MTLKQQILGTLPIALMTISFVAEANFKVSRSGDNYLVTNNDGCIAVFDKHGREKSSTDACSSRDLRDAEEAIDDFRDGKHSDSNRYSSSSHHSSRYSDTYWEVHRGSDGSLSLRRDPSEGAKAVVSKVRNGERLRGLGDCEEHHDTQWCRVEYKGDTGWVKKKYLREVSGGSGYSRHDSYDRQHENYSGGRGSGNKEKFADLQGSRASSADSELRQRGFDHVDTFKSGYTSYSIWYNDNTRQCLQMAVADGKADSIVDIKTHKKCH